MPTPTYNRSATALLWLILSIALSTAILLGTWDATARTRTADQELRRRLLRNAVDLAAAINVDLVAPLSFTAEDIDHPAYQELSATMRAVGETLPNRGIYSMILRDGELVFGPENYSPEDPMSSPPGTVYQEPHPESLAIFQHERPTFFGPYTDEFGTFITALVPVHDPRSRKLVMVVGFEILADDWTAMLRASRRPGFFRTGILLGLLLFSGIALELRNRSSDAIRQRFKHLDLALVIVLGMFLSWIIGDWINCRERHERSTLFESLAEMHVEKVRDTFQRVELKFCTFSRFLQTAPLLDEPQFSTFCRVLLREGEMLALGWIPLPDGLQNPVSDSLASRFVAPSDAPHIAWSERTEKRTSCHSNLVQSVWMQPNRVLSCEVPHQAASRYLVMQAIRDTRPPTPTPLGIAWADVDIEALLRQSFHLMAHETNYVLIHLRDVAGTSSASYGNEADEYDNGSSNSYRQAIQAFGRIFEVTARPTRDFTKAYPVQSGYVIMGLGFLSTLLIAAFAGIMRERYQTAELERSEQRYEQLFQCMTSGFALHELILDRQGTPRDYRFLQINPAFEHHTGLQADDLIGRTLYETLPDSEPIWLERYARVALTGAPETFEQYDAVLNKYFSVTAYRPAPKQFAVLVTDITLRKKTEEQLYRSQEMQHILIELALRFVNLPTGDIEVATVAALQQIGQFFKVDRAYAFEYDFAQNTTTNTQEWCAEGIRCVKDELQSLPLDVVPDLVKQHGEGSPYLVPQISDLENKSPLHALLTAQEIQTLITVPMQTGDTLFGFIGFDSVQASRVWTEDEIDLLKVLAQLLTNAYMRKHNETDRLDLERQIQNAQKLESLGLLAGGIAHDFNNILTTVLGNADLALEEISPLSIATSYVESVKKAARRAADLCQQMLAYAGRGNLKLAPFNTNELVEEMGELLRASISKRVQLKLELAKALPPVHGDASQIRQIILNLVINASEAIGDQNGTITLRTQSVRYDRTYLTESLLEHNLEPGPFVAVEVSDTGCGMDEETVAKIFDPFFSSKVTGRGLGLSAVIGIARGHGGSLRVYSEPGKGSVFKLLLPAIEQATAPAAARPGKHQTGNALWKGNGSILLVDDEEPVRALAKRILERFGFTVHSAGDGVEALEQFETNRSKIQAVLLDLTMPRMSGEETLEALRQRDRTIPIIIASGYSSEELHQRLIQKGVTDFVQKPYGIKALQSTLFELLGKNSAQ